MTLSAGIEADEDAMYLVRERLALQRALSPRRENVREYDETEHDLIKLDPDEILTTQHAAGLLASQIEPLPLPSTRPRRRHLRHL